MKRRDFVRFGASSLLTAPFILNGFGRNLYTDRYASSVISVLDQNATQLQFRHGTKLNSDSVIVDKIVSWNMESMRIARMVNTAVLKLTNKSSLGKAWESLFPKGHPNMNTRIGIKLNFSYGDWRNDEENNWAKMYCPFGPKSAITNAIISGLSQMLDGNFPIENITFIERMYSVGERKYFPVIQGFRPVSEDSDGLFKDKSAGAPGMHWIYASNPLELPDGAPSFIAAPDYPEKYCAPQRIYKAVYENDFLINYAIGKDHRAAGITGVMKNNYGCTDNPLGTHGNTEWRTDNSPFAGTRLCVPVFYKNVNEQAPYILNILDALTVVYQGGPLSGKVAHMNSIAVSKDPVALDAHLLDLVNNARKHEGLTLITTVDGRTPDGHPNASFLRIAAENHELGSLSQENVQYVDLSGSSLEYELPTVDKTQAILGDVIKSKDNYQVPIYLDNSKRTHTIESRIQDMRGRVIKAHATQTTRSSQLTLEWDHKNDEGSEMKEGVYIWYITVDGILLNCTVNDYYTV